MTQCSARSVGLPGTRLLQFASHTASSPPTSETKPMNRFLQGIATASVVCLYAGSAISASDPQASASASELVSGIDTSVFDTSVRPQDNFYQYVNGKWLESTEVPPDKGRYGSFDKLGDAAMDQLRTIVEELQQPGHAQDPEAQKLADLYSSFMEEPALEQLDLKPLASELARIDALRRKSEIPALIAHYDLINVSAPIDVEIDQDAKDSTRYVFELEQSGLGMPDRDYYLQQDSKLEQMRSKYRSYVEQLLSMSGDRAAASDAQQIFELETGLAIVHWSRVDNRDPVKNYNKFELRALRSLAPGFDWGAYLKAMGVTGRIDSLIVSQPSYVTGFDEMLRRAPLSVWKAYFRFHLINDYAPFLSKRFVDARFDFYGKTLRDIKENQPRWKRGIRVVEEGMGEALGQLYVARYFPPESKERMDQLVQNLIGAYRADLGTLDWMSAATREKAQEKLAKLGIKIGYPSKWRDYSALQVVPRDLVGNMTRARLFESERELNKLGHPIDRTEWDMTPQTVNAYYSPERNEIVFPAAILQPPFFNAKADDAVNYGGIGAVIGHEISHAFDDNGSQYDGEGNLLGKPGWFTPADLRQFQERTEAMVAQYHAYAPVAGYPINGRLTLGENIADNSGLSIAYKAYHLSLGGREAPVIDGLTGDQRFYIGWAQVWRAKARDNELITRIKTDPHSPDQIRGTVTEMNQAAFYTAFDVKPGDKMYLPPEKRISLW